jgi:hypothetical protein
MWTGRATQVAGDDGNVAASESARRTVGNSMLAAAAALGRLIRWAAIAP